MDARNEQHSESITCPYCRHPNPGGQVKCRKCNGMLPHSGADHLLGRTIGGNFKLLEVIGKGAAGKVYRGEQLSLGKEVAVKVLHKHLLGDRSLVGRFHREARATSRLNHPNCIQIIEFGQADTGELFIAVEYLPGHTLAQVLRRDFPLPAPRLLRIAEQICSALEEAHAQGIVHRDLKLENVMLIDNRGERDFVKVLDFGIVKIIDDEDGPNEGTLTKAGNVCGTPEYMAPEQAQGGDITPQTDLYAVGVMLYHIVTGQLPYTGGTPLVVATQHIMDPTPHARQVRPDLNIPPELDDLIARCMAKAPADRPRSAAALRQELQQVLGPLASVRTGQYNSIPASSGAPYGTGAQPMLSTGPPRGGGRTLENPNRRSSLIAEAIPYTPPPPLSPNVPSSADPHRLNTSPMSRASNGVHASQAVPIPQHIEPDEATRMLSSHLLDELSAEPPSDDEATRILIPAMDNPSAPPPPMAAPPHQPDSMASAVARPAVRAPRGQQRSRATTSNPPIPPQGASGVTSTSLVLVGAFIAGGLIALTLLALVLIYLL
ncbi:MAG: hypothetical protein CMH57_09900 [Myxococcales bacterium]|nr:hypothetical protein [Myxococcales bacterium]